MPSLNAKQVVDFFEEKFTSKLLSKEATPKFEILIGVLYIADGMLRGWNRAWWWKAVKNVLSENHLFTTNNIIQSSNIIQSVNYRLGWESSWSIPDPFMIQPQMVDDIIELHDPFPVQTVNDDDEILSVEERYATKHLRRGEQTFLTLDRDNILWSAFSLYKNSMADVKPLQKELKVSFQGEDGIDEGALTI